MNQGFCILAPFGAIALYGSERANLRVLESLRDHGARIHLVTNKYWGHLYIHQEVDRIGLDRSAAVFGELIDKRIFNPLFFLGVIKGVVATSLHVFLKIRESKSTHLYFGNMLFFLYSYFAIVFVDLPVIYRLGDTIPKGIRGWVMKSLIFRRASHIVCISHFMREHALREGIPDYKLSVIYNFPPPVLSRPSAGVVYRKDSETIIVSYVGQLIREKGVHLFCDMAIEFMKLEKKVLFYLAGDFSNESPFGEALAAKIKTLGFDKTIIFLGYLQDTRDLYQATDILCVPSNQQEPLGNVVLEAKSAGVPSVVFPDGGLPEMIDHGVDGFICRAKTMGALKEGVLYFLDSKDRLKEAKRKARESLRNFDHEKLTDQWLRVFEAARRDS